MRLHKWISIRGLGFVLAAMMLLSCVVLVPDEARETTHTNVAALALGTTVPTVPLNLQADAGNQFVWLWWDHPANQGSDLIKNYTIYRNATGSSTSFVKLVTASIGPFNPVGINDPYNDTAVLNGVLYYYQITADSDAGPSLPSNTASVTPVASAPPPGAVQNLVALNEVYATQLNWTAPANAGSTPIRYIHVLKPGLFGFSEHVLPATANGYRDKDVIPGEVYNYTVRAISSTWGGINASAEKLIGGTGDIPGSPTNLTAYGSNNSVLLFWDQTANPSSHGVVNYTILRSDAQAGPFSYIGNSSEFSIFGTVINAPLPLYSDSTAINGHKYYYEVVSNNQFGPSAPSNIANATPAYTATSPPAIAYPGNGQVLLVWSPISNATGIDIYRSTAEGIAGDLTNSTSADSQYYWYDNTTTNGIKYFYTVRANLSGVYLFSDQVNATPFVGSVPAAPTDLIATPDYSSVGLYAKLASSTDAIIGYSIYRGTSPGGEAAIPIKNVSTIGLSVFSILSYLTASDNTALDDVNYYYTMSVKNLFGESAHSNEAVSFASSTGDAPMPVSDLTATGGNGQATLTWNRPTYQGTANLMSYEILRYNGTAWNFVDSVISGLGQQTYVDTLLTSGTYRYSVLVSNNYGDALAQSNIAEATTTSTDVVPSAPINLITTSGTGYVLLSWSAPTTVGSGITNYKILRGTTSGGEGTTIFQTVSGSTLTYNDTSVIPGQTYYYEVAAVNSVGTSANSNEAVGTAPAPNAPTAPINLTAFAGQGEIILNWSAPTSVGTGITEYRIFRGATAGGEDSTPITTVLGTILTFIDSNVIAGTPYYYSVKAVNSAGLGPASNEASATALVVAGVPGAPIALTSVVGSNYILLNWTAPTAVGSGLTNYKLYRGTTAGGEVATPIATLAGTVLTYNDTAITLGVHYYYVVKAVNSAGTGNPSTEVNAIVINPLVPTAPKDVSATPGTGQIVVSWVTPDSAGASAISGYQIYRSVNGSQMVLIGNTTKTSFTDTNVDVSHTYGYAVAATNSNGSSLNSTLVTSTPTANKSTSDDNNMLFLGIGLVAIVAVVILAALLMMRRKSIASAPVGLTALTSAGNVQLNWSTPTKAGGDVTEYRIYRGTKAGGEGTTPIGTVPGAARTFADQTVVAGTSYYYVVRAVNSAGEGVASNEVSVKAVKS